MVKLSIRNAMVILQRGVEIYKNCFLANSLIEYVLYFGYKNPKDLTQDEINQHSYAKLNAAIIKSHFGESTTFEEAIEICLQELANYMNK